MLPHTIECGIFGIPDILKSFEIQLFFIQKNPSKSFNQKHIVLEITDMWYNSIGTIGSF